MNLCYLVSLPASVAVLGATFAYALTQHAYNGLPGYALCHSLFGVALFIEMLSEPMFVVAGMENRIGLRVAADSVAMLLRVVVMFVLVVVFEFGLEAHGFAQLVYAFALFVSFSLQYRFRWRRSMLPRRVSGRWFEPGMMQTTHLFTLQSLQKFVLTEGEKIVMVTLYQNPSGQGVYGLVQNLGSLLARFVFQPIEEVSAMQFSRLHHDVDGNSPDVDEKKVMLRLLGAMQKLVVLLGLLASCFGPPFAFVALDGLYGARWSSTSAPSLLSLYSVYVLFMAFNGVSEAFVCSVVSGAELRVYNHYLALFALSHIASTAALLRFGEHGIIIANMLNMSVRIAYSLSFIRSYFGRSASLKALPLSLPSRAVFVALLVSGALLHASRCWLRVGSASGAWRSAFLPHIAIGVVALFAIGVTLFVSDRPFLYNMRHLLTATNKHAEHTHSD